MERKEVAQPDITNVHSLLFGDNNELITNAVKKEAREIVSDVISEAMHDRQRKDQSLSKTLAPMMETAISQSIENNKANLISSLYPVVGGLVRKSVSVFFNNFMEKLNYLIEYSLTIKGIKWRFAAWRQGIPFAQYIIKRSFVYRVENVMLIHRDSGTLLCDVASEHSECNDPELMSAMLTAINDFMADSFHHDSDVVLDTIKTQDLTLISAGAPTALLVAAVSGLPPSELQSQLQVTLEELLALLADDLNNYQGDNTAFINAESHLRGCLLSEVNPAHQQQKKPIWAIAIVSILLLVGGYQLVNHWQRQALLDKVVNLPAPAGFHLQQAKWQSGKLAVTIFRDPAAMTVNKWQSDNQLPVDKMAISELNYASLNDEIVNSKITHLLNPYPLTFTFDSGQLSLNGQLAAPLPDSIFNQLRAIPGVNSLDSKGVSLTHSDAGNEQAQLRLVLDRLSAELAIKAIEFDLKSSTLTAQMHSRMLTIASKINQINAIAKQLKLSVGIVITGYSDRLGAADKNQQLSSARAEQVRKILLANSVPAQLLYAVGAGELPLNQLANGARRVMFTTIILPASDSVEAVL